MTSRTVRPKLPDLARQNFEADEKRSEDEALKRQLKALGEGLGFGSRQRESNETIEEQQSKPVFRTLQLIIPDYLFEQLHMDAARQRVTKKYLVLMALQRAGYHIEKGDMDEDGRRNR